MRDRDILGTFSLERQEGRSQDGNRGPGLQQTQSSNRGKGALQHFSPESVSRVTTPGKLTLCPGERGTRVAEGLDQAPWDGAVCRKDVSGISIAVTFSSWNVGDLRSKRFSSHA